MKRRTAVGIIISFIFSIALIGLGIYLMTDLSRPTGSEGEPSSAGPETQAPETVLQTGGGSQPEETLDEQTARALAAASEANANSLLPEHHVIFVGDSRTVGMWEAEEETGDGCSYIGAVGEGYHWFVEEGILRMEDAMEAYPESPVVINLGVNDLDMIGQYLELYALFPDVYPERSFYFMSVNPVTREAAHVTNEEIAAFNAQLKETFPDQYLDSSTYLNMKEFESVDGVHYTKDTYRMIHDFTVRQLFS